MKKLKLLLFILFIPAVIISVICFQVKTNTKRQDVTYPVLSEEQQKYLEEFARILEQNSKRISSIKDSINNRYKYSYDITGIRKSTDDPYKNIPYYGKCDLHKGFIFGLHRPLKIFMVEMFHIGYGDYLGIDKQGNAYSISIEEKDTDM